MTLSYHVTTLPGKLRSFHTLMIDGDIIQTTRKKELLVWAKPKMPDKYAWKQLKEAIRLETSLTVVGGE